MEIVVFIIVIVIIPIWIMGYKTDNVQIRGKDGKFK